MPNDETLMREAIKLAHQAESEGEVPVGAVVVNRNGEIIGRGYNQTISLRDPSAHAEVIAIRHAAQVLNNYRLTDCRLYVTLEPCCMCSGIIFHARLQHVIYASPDPKTGTAGGVLNLFENPSLNHQTLVRSGVCHLECQDILKQFFRKKREEKKNGSLC